MAISHWLRVPAALLLLTGASTGLTNSSPAAAQSGGCAVSQTELPLDGEEQAAIDSMNALRSGAGMAPFSTSPRLTRAAVAKSSSMAASGVMSHDDPGRSWSQRIRDCGYSAGAAAENLAVGPESGRAAAQMWRDSALHLRNILDPGMRAVGVARVAAGGAYYWTANFGTVADGAATTPPAPLAPPLAAAPAPAPGLAAPTAVPAPRLAGTATVNAGRNDCLNVRAAPARGATIVTCLVDGQMVRISGAAQDRDGITWWPVNGLGWVAGTYLDFGG